MKANFLFITTPLATLLVSCSLPTPYQPNAEEIKSADYGAYPSDYKKIIKRHLQPRLKDPETARYRFTRKPRKIHSTAYSKEDVRYYYQVPVAVNGMNSYGNYTGESIYVYDIKNGKILTMMDASWHNSPELILYGKQ